MCPQFSFTNWSDPKLKCKLNFFFPMIVILTKVNLTQCIHVGLNLLIGLCFSEAVEGGKYCLRCHLSLRISAKLGTFKL